MLCPCPPIRCGVKHHRLEIVHCVGKAGFRRLSGVEFLPERPESTSLLPGQHTKDAVSSTGFPVMFRCFCRLIIGISIPCINLHQVMNQQHGYRPQQVNGLIGVFRQQNGHQRNVPGMLGIVFLPAASGEIGLPPDLLFLVDFPDKGNLLLQSVLHRLCLLFCFLLPV